MPPAPRFILCLVIATIVPSRAEAEMNAEAFEPTWDSLRQYRCPEWFRDAKFGIWAHWGPQTVPEFGDWYARFLYNPRPPLAADWEAPFGERFYKHHLEHFGHPSQHGAKDLCRAWTAERWDPDALIDLFTRAGAKYFVALANHHDNFDCWDSHHQQWNAVKVGPKRDVVGDWAKAARANGLRFGVSVHASRAWSWLEPSRGADDHGPLKGEPYDGNLTKEQGIGTWWEGLDPQDLYGRPHPPGEPPDEAYVRKFRLRTIDLIDRYQPDLIYFDDEHALPFGQTGLDIAAHFYNSRAHPKLARTEAVLNFKKVPPEQRSAVVMDIEKGQSDRLEPHPWQTCTCLGNWFYVRDYDYKPAGTVIATLVDVVSKNGNLLLSVPMRGDGTIDERERRILEEIANWMGINGEAIFGTRPWTVWGEGPTKIDGGPFSEKAAQYTPQDVRFTTRGDVLYALVMDWPDDARLTVRALAAGSEHYPHAIADVRLLGCDAPLRWDRDAGGLNVRLPARRPCEHVFVLKINRRK